MAWLSCECRYTALDNAPENPHHIRFSFSENGMIAGSFVSPAQLVGYVALVLGVSAFLQRNDTRLKVLIAAESIAYVVHFILLGNYPASGSALVSCVRILTSIKSRAPVWIAIFIGINVAIGVTFAKGFAGWLPISASCLATVAMFRMRGVAMRIVLLVCTLLWLVNNILSGSVGGTALEAIIAVVNLFTVIRLALEKRRMRRETPAATVRQTVAA